MGGWCVCVCVGGAVCKDPQGGIERAVGWGEGCCRAVYPAAGRHSVATLTHRLAGPPVEQSRKKKNEKDEKDGDPPCWTE